MKAPWDELAQRAQQHHAELAAAEEGCDARGWRFLGVHPVSGAWSAETHGQPKLTVRTLSFSAFVFVLLEADELRQQEIAKRGWVTDGARAHCADSQGELL